MSGGAVNCPICGRVSEIYGCPQIGDGTDESVIECQRLGLERLKAENASLREELEEARNEACVRCGFPTHDITSAAEQRAEAAEKERDELARDFRNYKVASKAGFGGIRGSLTAAEKRSTELMEQLDALAKTSNSMLAGRCRCGARQIGPTRWIVDGHGPWDCARAALHDEELSAPPHEPPEIVSHGWTHVIALPAAEGAPCDCGRPPVKHLRDQRTCISAAAQGEEK